LQIADLKIYDANNILLTLNQATDVYVSSVFSNSYTADKMFDSSLTTFYNSQGFYSQYVGVKLPTGFSKIQVYTRQDAFSYRWVGANVTVATPTFNSTTVITYDVADKMLAFVYNAYGLVNVMTTTQPTGGVVNYTHPTSTFVTSYFLTGPAFYRNGTGQLYFLENGVLKSATGQAYALKGGHGKYTTLSYTDLLAKFNYGNALTITSINPAPVVLLWLVLFPF
jgi:hypothetical protein